MKINFLRKRIERPLKEDIALAVSIVLDSLKQSKNVTLNIEFIEEGEMRELNNRMRGIDSVTDVLSFPNFSLKPFETFDPAEDDFLGDMAICLKRAESQAKDYGVSTEKEIIKLVIHSALHLMGFDHIEDCDYKVMNGAEEKAMKKFLASTENKNLYK